MQQTAYDIDAIRAQMRAQMSSRPKDPFEFRPPKIKKGETVKYRYFVLPPLKEGDKCASGLASRDMGAFAIKNGQHWVNNSPHPCPRAFNNEECQLCSIGFDLLNEAGEDDDKRKAIVKRWLAQQLFAVNIYFPNVEANPEDVRGKTMWTNAQKVVMDMFMAALNRDSGGDAADPEAYGVFFDENNAYLFQLEVKGEGKYNGYKGSKFLANLGRMPIVGQAGKPNAAAIQKILDSRHDLWTKIEVPDPQKIAKLAHKMISGDVGGEGGEGGGEGGEGGIHMESDEHQTKAVAQKTAAAPAKAAPVTAPAAAPKAAAKAVPAAAAATKAAPAAAAKAAAPKPAAKPAPVEPEPEPELTDGEEDSELAELLARVTDDN